MDQEGAHADLGDEIGHHIWNVPKGQGNVSPDKAQGGDIGYDDHDHCCIGDPPCKIEPGENEAVESITKIKPHSNMQEVTTIEEIEDQNEFPVFSMVVEQFRMEPEMLGGGNHIEKNYQG